MTFPMNDRARPRLERSCGSAAADWIKIAPSCRGFERVEASFSGHAFDPHRHDIYAIGCTIHGVQSFRYRGVSKRSVMSLFAGSGLAQAEPRD
ncbi:MAG: AraC family ligand binding domain-containing protein [Gammaproteobacteria bacterium]|nr:AraC family ligand binding domain-containing protein [Gammaproteobacteria bacterium]